MKPRVSLYFSAAFLAFFAAAPLASAQDVRITEFLASNIRGLQDEDRATSDWIEIYNAGTNGVNLLNWGLTDDRSRPFRWRFPSTNINAGAYIIVFASNKDRRIPGLPLHTSFGLKAGGGYLALTRPDGTKATEFDEYPAQAPDVSYGFGDYATNITVITSNSAVRVQVPTDDSDGTNWTTVAYNDSAWLSGTNGVGFGAPFVRTDIQAAMSNVNASARIRLPFVLTSTNIASLTLRMRYNDGFSAFMNAVPLIGANAPDPLLFNSPAADIHSSTAFEDFRLSARMLTAGTNLLTIQALNAAVDDPDFLAASELVLAFVSQAPLYFTRPTPGTANSAGAPYAGPAISEETHRPNVPKDNDDLFVLARVRQTLFPVTNVVLRYRVMFGSEIELGMFDDGAHGDAAAGDGVYGAIIPANASTPSQMIRWVFRATDNRGNTSRWPLFSNPTNAAEYFGTMVDYTVASRLPVIHLFAPTSVLSPGPITPDGVGADGPGGPVGVFYDGEFYDNVNMSVRGNTTAGYDKKSHRLEFNSEHLFRHSDQYPRIGNTSFVAEWPDPSYMRQGLSFWLCNLIGSPAPFYYPVRLQLNGVFYQLANHNDVHDEDLLDRLGFDPNGALYNAAGRVNLPNQSTGVLEKKTRGWDSLPGTATGTNPRGYGQDFVRLTTGIAETNSMAVRRINAYDLFDIPNAINYLVAARWAHENDDVWANMSVYHDNDGDDLWRLLAFDMNLSWGAIFYEGTAGPLIGVGLPGNVIGTFDAHKGHPLYGSQVNTAVSGPDGGAAWNRVYDLFFQQPDLREMFLRRMRTMMDQYLKPPGLSHPALYPMETHVRELRDAMLDDAEIDRNFWSWAPRGGQCNFDPGIRLTAGANDLINYFIIPRRQHFYVTHSITNTSKPIGIGTNQNAGIPLEQPANAAVQVAFVEYNPGSGNQLHEYLTLTNPNPYAVDISDWKLSGGVEFTFAKGTVMPSNTVLYVSPNVRVFKTRPVAPRGGMGLFVVGPYKGQLSARGEPLMISNDSGTMVYSNVYAGAPSLPQQYLRITEIMYNPTPIFTELTDRQEYEFVELKNISSSQTINLNGVRFTSGITFNFTGSAITSLAPGERVLVVKNRFAFEARYGTAHTNRIAGQYTGFLDNSGDRITLVDASNEEIHDFDYEDDWYPITDGGGFSLAIVDENAEMGMWDSKLNWRPSGQENGAPGDPETAPQSFPPILVNEVLTHTDLPAVDAIELFNATNVDVNIGGWFITDDFSDAKKYRIPDGTIIPAGGYLVFDETQFNPNGFGFAFSSTGDEAYLFSGDANTNLTGYVHGYSFGASANGVSFGRHTNSVGDVHFVAQSDNTLPGQNVGPRIGPVIISEFLYRPQDLAGGRDNSADEYIELQNISDGSVSLFDPANPQNTWVLRGGVDYDFPPNITLPAGGFALVANFDVTDPFALSAFRQKFSVPPTVPIFGPYRGQLGNGGDEIELKRPEMMDTNLVHIMIEQVDYKDESPWPPTADGTGAALHRFPFWLYANDPANWIAAAPSAGRAYVGGAAPVITVQPADQNGLALGNAAFSVGATGAMPLRYQWHFNGTPVPDATNSYYNVDYLPVDLQGGYHVTVLNHFGAVTSRVAAINVRLGAIITAQPLPATVKETSNAVFGVSVYTNAPPVTFQWQREGVDIPGQTGPTLTIVNAQSSDEAAYRVIVRDPAGSVASRSARLTVQIPASMLTPVPPINVTGVGGETIILNAQLRGTLPIFVRWRLLRNVGGNIIVSNQFADSLTARLTYTLNTNDSGRVALSITNIAGGNLSGVTNNAFITVLLDTDKDGIPDIYEAAHGMNSNDVADAQGDLDGDTMVNRAEYIAGTDPQDPSSYLKIDNLAGGGPATVSFLAVSNRSYTIVYSDTLEAPEWNKVGNILARSTNWPASVIDSAPNPRRFYRLITPSQP